MKPKQKPPEKRERDIRGRIVYYSIIAGLLAAAWNYQPYEFDLVPRKSPDGTYEPKREEVDLFNPKNRVLIVTAHPDDSELLVGGTLTLLAQHKVPIYQVICTDGDKGYYIYEDAAKNRRVRHEEATNAVKAWHGSSLTFLGHADGRLRADETLSSELEREIEKVNPTHILCFDGPCPTRQSHSDHRYSGEATEIAANRVAKDTWLIRFQTNGQNFGVDISDVWDKKVDLLKIHESQFFGKKLDGIVGMAESMAERAGEKLDGQLAEGFRCSKPHGG
jgi:hypothetical protein